MTEQAFQDFWQAADDGQQWEIDFDDGPTRTTTLAWIAYRAMDDDSADVTAL